ncbi:MAG: hypothetical protein B7Z01_09360 [Brevundimonas subvibrioides]|uniref:Uncharacterized protein n=2 Tax=Brevundimonas TaxID=41275 RepID=A0A258FLD0_9CAUL|nr:MAG: hypothetical protein B7Z01_09360 [Brevundimonas subvibrioides]
MEGDMTDGSPPTASDRIVAIRAAMADDAEAGAAFAESVLVPVEAALERLDAISGSAPHAEAAALLTHVRDRVTGLDAARLEPRRGLAGLFDSRGKRLKAFRAAYLAAAETAASGAADLADRGGAIVRRGNDLEALWTQLRAGLTDLDDHVAAGRGWLADRAVQQQASPVPPEAAAAFEDASDTPAGAETAPAEAEMDPVEAQADAEARFQPPSRDMETQAAPGDIHAPGAEKEQPPVSVSEAAEAHPESDPAAVAALPHPLEGRLETLARLRARTIAALPRIRALQNADHTVPAALAAAREGIEAWSADWREALGLAGKRPRKVRPDGTRLVESRDALVADLSTAERAVAAAQARLAELTPRAREPMVETRAAA